MSEIHIGDKMVLKLRTADGESIHFDGDEGDDVIVVMSSDDFDTYLELEYDGKVIAKSDDHVFPPGSFESALKYNSLIHLKLPATGKYLIRAASYDSDQDAVGLEFTVTVISHKPTTRQIGFDEPTKGQTVPYPITNDLWEIKATEGDIILIEGGNLTASDFLLIASESNGVILSDHSAFGVPNFYRLILLGKNEGKYQFSINPRGRAILPSSPWWNETGYEYELKVRKLDYDSYTLKDGDNRKHFRYEVPGYSGDDVRAIYDVFSYKVTDNDPNLRFGFDVGFPPNTNTMTSDDEGYKFFAGDENIGSPVRLRFVDRFQQSAQVTVHGAGVYLGVLLVEFPDGKKVTDLSDRKYTITFERSS